MGLPAFRVAARNHANRYGRRPSGPGPPMFHRPTCPQTWLSAIRATAGAPTAWPRRRSPWRSTAAASDRGPTQKFVRAPLRACGRRPRIDPVAGAIQPRSTWPAPRSRPIVDSVRGLPWLLSVRRRPATARRSAAASPDRACRRLRADAGSRWRSAGRFLPRRRRLAN